MGIFAGRISLSNVCRRWLYAVWMVSIAALALLHALHLGADFPNHTPWFSDWAKYTDEGWYGNAAIRAHLFGNWYLPGDFNPAPAVPVWPFLEWILFFFTGVTIEAARGLAVFFFFCNLLLSYLLLRAKGARWMALLALTLIVTSPFLFSFSRLAILEPMLTAFTLTAFNLAVRLPRLRRPVWASVAIGLLFTLMMLTKTTAVFLLPALGWAILLPLWPNRRLAVRTAVAAAGSFVLSFGLWMALVIHAGLLKDYKYLFFVNKYNKPQEFYWPLVSFWWSFHGGLWVDHILIPLAGLLAVGALLAGLWRRGSQEKCGWARRLLLDPVFGASILAVAGYILFMTYQDHPQPRYFAVVAFFSFFVIALGVEALLERGNALWLHWLGGSALAAAVLAAAGNSTQTLYYATHPEYTYVNAAERLTRFIDEHPNGRRLLVSISGDQLTLMTHLPTLCDDFGTLELVTKIEDYQPGWFATWNDIDPGALEDLHNRYSLEQVAKFRALDDPDRNVLVLFKLHPLPNGQLREPTEQNLQVVLPDDKVYIDVR
jgi:4-amino-4-deoxy-L-arabinose transferase-like glycosyltransferase